MEEPVSKTTFAIIALVVGMGGTLLVLWLLTVLISLMNKVLPERKKPTE